MLDHNIFVIDRDGKRVSNLVTIQEARGIICLLNLQAGEYRYTWAYLHERAA